MKHAFNRFLAALSTFCFGLTQALAQEGAPSAPEPTVSAFWVLVFVVVFFGVCAWFGYSMWRAERESRAKAQQNG